MANIVLYDTTLRDGKQAEGINFSLNDMIAIAKKLDMFGIDYIECGWPSSNPKDKAFFDELQKIELKNSKVAAFGMTRHAKHRVADDPNIKDLLATKTPVVTIFGKSWDLHVTDVFRISLDENIAMISDSVKYLKDNGKEVFFDAEHFFDGFQANPDYALKALRAAEEAGADALVLCDTNGGMIPQLIAKIVSRVKKEMKGPIGIHVHNDSDCAVANSLEAVNQGATHVQGTVNGIGERCGNANLISIMPNLAFKMGHTFAHVDAERMKKLSDLSHYVYEIANLPPETKQPYTGLSAFAHKAGVHVNAVEKNTITYEHINPAQVGNKRRILVSEQSGKSNILEKAKELGIKLLKQFVPSLVTQIKDLENSGYEFEGADASFELLARKTSGQFKERFTVDSFKTFVHVQQDKSIIEATVKVKVGDLEELTVAEGDGPVNALDTALKNALSVFYPVVKNIQLTDYKVRILNPKAGTAALTRVLISFRYNGYEWGTVGVSGNIIEASWQALVDSMNYILMKLEDEQDKA